MFVCFFLFSSFVVCRREEYSAKLVLHDCTFVQIFPFKKCGYTWTKHCGVKSKMMMALSSGTSVHVSLSLGASEVKEGQ